MSTVFGVPCPECGQQLAAAGGADLQCPACRQTYQARMGHLFPVGDAHPRRSRRPARPARADDGVAS